MYILEEDTSVTLKKADVSARNTHPTNACSLQMWHRLLTYKIHIQEAKKK